MSFENLKSARGSSIDKLVKAAEAVSTPKADNSSYEDNRLWKPTRDKAGNGYAVIRFLPAKEGEDLPWVRYWDHGFKGPNGQWYIEKSLTSINQPDPVSESNTVLWNTGRDEDKALARERKRRLHYVTNVYVVSDSSAPQNEGKVFLYKFGKKIFDKIMAAMQPEFEDESPINPFDFWQGANFKVKIKKVAGYWNYDSSEFAAVSPLLDDDKALEEIWKKEYSLAEITDASQFKTYDELKKRFDYVLGNKKSTVSQAFDEEVASEELPPRPEEEVATTFSESDEGDDALSYFQRLAEE